MPLPQPSRRDRSRPPLGANCAEHLPSRLNWRAGRVKAEAGGAGRAPARALTRPDRQFTLRQSPQKTQLLTYSGARSISIPTEGGNLLAYPALFGADHLAPWAHIATYGFLISERETIPPQNLVPPGGSKNLPFPPVTDPAAPPLRPERHVPNSIATMRRRLAVALANRLSRCPCCQAAITARSARRNL